MLNQRPAAQQNLYTLSLPNVYELVLPVIKQEGDIAWLSPNNQPAVLIRRFTPSSLVELITLTQETRKGILIKHTELSVADPELQALIPVRLVDSSKTYTTAKLKKVFPIVKPSTTWLNKEALTLASGNTAKMQAVCVVTNTHQPGMIRWSLYKKDTSTGSLVELAQGNDLLNPKECLISVESYLWSVGTYVLKVKRCGLHLNTLKTASIEWSVIQPTRLLSAGYPEDSFYPMPLN